MTIVRSIFAYDRAGVRSVGAVMRMLGVALSAVGGEAIGGHGAAVLAGVGALYAESPLLAAFTRLGCDG